MPPRFGTKSLLIVVTLVALWLSTFAGFSAGADVRASILLLIFVGSAVAALCYRGTAVRIPGQFLWCYAALRRQRLQPAAAPVLAKFFTLVVFVGLLRLRRYMHLCRCVRPPTLRQPRIRLTSLSLQRLLLSRRTACNLHEADSSTCSF